MPTEHRRALVGIFLALSTFVAAPAAAEEAPRGEGPPSTSAGWLDGRRFSAGLAAEVTVVGLSYGPRAEVLYRPFDPDGGTHLRLAAGVLPGLEFTFVPLNVGWRHVWRRGRTVQPHFGAGFEEQFFVIPDAYTVDRPALYLETGVDFRVWKRGLVGLQIAPDLAVFKRPGFGLATRIQFRWDFGSGREGP